jgi:hypothetical protein
MGLDRGDRWMEKNGEDLGLNLGGHGVGVWVLGECGRRGYNWTRMKKKKRGQECALFMRTGRHGNIKSQVNAIYWRI